MVRRDSPIVKRGWIDILFKSGPPHLQIIHTLLPGAVPMLPHPRLPCHTQNRGPAQIGLSFFRSIRTLLEPMILVLAKSRQQHQDNDNKDNKNNNNDNKKTTTTMKTMTTNTMTTNKQQGRQ